MVFEKNLEFFSRNPSFFQKNQTFERFKKTYYFSRVPRQVCYSLVKKIFRFRNWTNIVTAIRKYRVKNVFVEWKILLPFYILWLKIIIATNLTANKFQILMGFSQFWNAFTCFLTFSGKYLISLPLKNSFSRLYFTYLLVAHSLQRYHFTPLSFHPNIVSKDYNFNQILIVSNRLRLIRESSAKSFESHHLNWSWKHWWSQWK